MFESYFLHQTAYLETARKPLGFSFVVHLFVLCLIITAPYLVVKRLEAPLSALSVFEALPPPPPAGGSSTKPKEKIKSKEPDALQEPDKAPLEPPPDDKPKIEGGVDGGVEGGVVGGV